MFMQPNDRLIIMNDAHNHLLPHEFSALAGVGVKTILFQGGFCWDTMQPAEDSPFNWDKIDGFVAECDRAGLRALMPMICSLPDWFPPDWYYSKETSGPAHYIPSYTNPHAAQAIDGLITEAIARYSGAPVQFTFGMPSDGEFPTNFWPSLHDIDFPHEVLRDWIIGRQKVFVTQYNEVWTAYHPYTEPAWWNCVYDGLMAAFPEATHRQLVYTYWPHSGKASVEQYVEANRKRGIGMFVGSEWVTGLRAHMRWLQERGLYGFLTCPNHYTQINKRVTQWMLDDIAWSVKELENYANV